MLLFLLVVGRTGLDAFLDPRDGARRRRRRNAAAGTSRKWQAIHKPEHVGALSGAVLQDWRPEDKAFWEKTGRAVARRNLWLSIPALLLSFAIWQVWSVVVAKLPLVGFKFSTDQLFWLAALPGLCGATLRIFYSFMVPMFGGRLWTTLATWSLLIPAIGIGYAVQNPRHALCRAADPRAAVRLRRRQFRFLHGQYFLLLPEGGKGQRAGAQRGARQSRRQRGAVRGPAGHHRWRVRLARRRAADWSARRTRRRRSGCRTPASSSCPSSPLSAFAAWFGMNDIASAKASFAEQAVIFTRAAQLDHVLALHRHLRFVHRLFGRLPAAGKILFPQVDALHLRLSRPAGRRAVAFGHGLGRRPLGRRRA